MLNKNQPVNLVTIALALTLAVVAGGSFLYVSKIKSDMGAVRAALVKDNQFLRNQAEILQDTVSQKTRALEEAESLKKTYEDQVVTLKDENTKLKTEFDEKIASIESARQAIRKKLYKYEKATLADRLKDAMRNEKDQGLLAVLKDTMARIETVKSGGAVTLEPIDISTSEAKGMILSLDRRNDLIVLNMGTREGLKEGDRVSILAKDGKEVGTAEIISTRYTLSAAFVDDLNYGYSIKNVKEGYGVVIAKKK